jgi:peptidoglycan LD-endopeptidase CwlK
MDKISLKRIEKAHPLVRTELLDICKELDDRGLTVRFTDVYRSIAEQDELYAQGRTKPGSIVTNARGGQSYHNYGLAIDFCLLKKTSDGTVQVVWDREIDLNSNDMADWTEVVFVFKYFGWSWGGDWSSFKDYPHFEKSFGLTSRQLKEIHDNGQVDVNGYVILPPV